MNWKHPTILVVALGAGFFGERFTVADGDTVATSRSAPLPAPADMASSAVISATVMPVDTGQEVAALQKELNALRRRSDTLETRLQSIPVPALNGRSRSPAEIRNRMEADLDARAAAQQQLETDKLVAAGFTPERITWLRHRGEERYSMALQVMYERQQNGLTTFPQYSFDEDLDLVKDIGETEYDRYRQALGRPLSPTISAVQGGSSAEGAGLMPGDEVIRYGGNRVYNIDQLKSLASEAKPGGLVPVEVRRGGQIVQLSMMGGSTGADGETMAQARLRELESRMPESLRNALRQEPAVSGR